jgi:CBS domain-containing protein
MRGADVIAVATPTDPLATTFERLAGDDIDPMPVIDHGALVGVLRRRDVARSLGGILG